MLVHGLTRSCPSFTLSSTPSTESRWARSLVASAWSRARSSRKAPIAKWVASRVKTGKEQRSSSSDIARDEKMTRVRVSAFMRTEGGSDFGGEEVMSRRAERPFRLLFRPFRGTESAAVNHDDRPGRGIVTERSSIREVYAVDPATRLATPVARLSSPSTPSTRGACCFAARRVLLRSDAMQAPRDIGACWVLVDGARRTTCDRPRSRAEAERRARRSL